MGIYLFLYAHFPVQKNEKETSIIIPQIDSDDEGDMIRTLLLFHASDYFVYKGIPIGFQYTLLRELEKKLGRNMEIKIETNITNMKKEMSKNDYDIVVMDFNFYGFLPPDFQLSVPHSYSYPVLVSNKIADTVENTPIFVSNDFSAKVFFTDYSPFHNLPIQQIKNNSTEELFERVDNGDLDYLICDHNQAITLIPFYSNVIILEKAGPQFERRWLLKKKNTQLNEDINHWLLDFKKTQKYRWLVRKYFSPESTLVSASFAKKNENCLSNYDAIIKKYAQQYDFDWRFVASIICQETKFNSGLTGKGGSFGLMQMMPVTMEYYGVSENDGDEAHIRAGVQHLYSLRNAFDDIDNEEKNYFVAAAYNAGRGHIFDARRLCTKYGANFKKWNDVSKYLKLKSQREYATDSLAKSGYFPGAHTVKYVQEVMNRYEVYKAAYQ